MPSNTASYNFYLPTVGGDTNAWGGYLNSNWDDIDDLLDGTTPVAGIDIDGGTIDGTPIGGTTPAAGAFTTLSSSGAATLASGSVTGSWAVTGALSAGSFAIATLSGVTGSAMKLVHVDTDQTLELYGGTEDNGAGILLYGDTHATKANDFEFYSQTNLVYAWDDSADTHNFYAAAGTLAAALAANQFKFGAAATEFTLSQANTDALLTVSGGNGPTVGANFRVFGSTHATQANDFQLRVGTNNLLHFDYSAASWGFYDGAGTTLGNVLSTGVLDFTALRETDYSLAGTALSMANGGVQYKTLSANTTFTDGLSNGDSITLMIDDGTAYTITWPTITWLNNGGSAPTLATTGYTCIEVFKSNSVLYGLLVADGT